MDEAMTMEGFLDRFKFWENIKIYKDVTSGDVLRLLEAAKSKDVTLIRLAVLKVASNAGYAMDAKEVDDVVRYVQAQNVPGIVYELGDYQMKFAVKHLGFVPEDSPSAGPIRMMGVGIDEERLAKIIEVIRAAIPILTIVGNSDDGAALFEANKRTEKFTNAEAKAWLSENRADVRKGGDRIAVRIALRNAPEVIASLTGKPMADLDIPTVGGFVPYMIPVVIVLKMIVARYESNHPTGSVKAVGDPADIGLSLEDL